MPPSVFANAEYVSQKESGILFLALFNSTYFPSLISSISDCFTYILHSCTYFGYNLTRFSHDYFHPKPHQNNISKFSSHDFRTIFARLFSSKSLYQKKETQNYAIPILMQSSIFTLKDKNRPFTHLLNVIKSCYYAIYH